MKKLLIGRASIFIAIIIIFVFGQIMGAIIIKSFFINYKIRELSPQVSYIAREIAEGRAMVSRRAGYMVKAYDTSGVEMSGIYIDDPPEWSQVIEEDVYRTLIQAIPKISVGKDLAVLQKVQNEKLESIILGKAIIKDGKNIGTVFLMQFAGDYQAVLNGFYLVFCITLIAGTLTIILFLYFYLKEIKHLEQTKRDYIANISHELKSPIASIKALAETLSDNLAQNNEDRDKYYGIILLESNRLQKLISDMLELSRLQSGKEVFRKEVVNTGVIMRQIHDKYFTFLDDLDIRFKVTEAAMAAPDIFTNRDRLLQIFNILIDNAAKFAFEGGVITVDAAVSHGLVTMIVADNGKGIEKSVLPFIFDRFFKEDKSHNNGGSGLGLSIAKEIIDGLGESITVKSEYGKGSEFSFTVRRARENQ
ncbi:MAG: hypothetical protein HGA22_00095 [Clostridiales bacterium]|nr:hypothetical protein [Clostridiales bacterium]